MAEQGADEKRGDPAAEEERLRPGRRLIGIHQPAFMPWLGYFDKMARVDVFVFLDTVQFTKNDWQNRNRILLDGAPHWLTVPVRFSFGDRIVDVATGKLNKGDWREKHLALLRHAYRNAPYLDWLLPMLEELYAPDLPRLVDWTLRSTMLLARLLGIHTPVVFSSHLQPPPADTRDQRLLDICLKYSGTAYMRGAHGTYMDTSLFAAAGVEVIDQKFSPFQYDQGGVPFVPALSALDLLMWHGPNAAQMFYERQALTAVGAV